MGNVLRAIYRDVITSRRQEVAFWVLLAFLPTFLIARALVYFDPHLFLKTGGTHIHHLTYGIILLAITGFMALTIHAPRWQGWIAALYGVGLALAFDEFGMWLRLSDNYYIRQSYDAIIAIGAFLIFVVYFAPLWGRLVMHLMGVRKFPVTSQK